MNVSVVLQTPHVDDEVVVVADPRMLVGLDVALVELVGNPLLPVPLGMVVELIELVGKPLLPVPLGRVELAELVGRPVVPVLGGVVVELIEIVGEPDTELLLLLEQLFSKTPAINPTVELSRTGSAAVRNSKQSASSSTVVALKTKPAQTGVVTPKLIALQTAAQAAKLPARTPEPEAYKSMAR